VRDVLKIMNLLDPLLHMKKFKESFIFLLKADIYY